MGSGKMESFAKEKLRTLCCSNDWSFGVLWRLDQRNSMLLRVEDAYIKEQMQTVVKDLLLQVHILGEGIIGQTAVSGKHQWISAASVECQDLLHADSEISSLISSAMKTICIIPLESQGVIQLGSIQKIPERLEFVEQAKRLFSDMESACSFDPMTSKASSLACDASDLNDWFSSFCNGSISPIRGENCDQLVEFGCTSSNSALRIEEAKIVPSFVDSGRASSHWSNGGSILTSLESHLGSEMEVCDLPWSYNTGGLVELAQSIQEHAGRRSGATQVDSLQQSDSSSVTELKETETLCGFSADMSKFFKVDNPFELMSTNSGLHGPRSGLLQDVILEIPFNQPANISQSCVSNDVAQNDLFEVLGLRSSANEITKVGPQKGLFSELGLEELLGGIRSSRCDARSSIIDDGAASPAKRIKMENSSYSVNQVHHLGNVSCSSSRTSMPASSLEYKEKNLVFSKSPMAMLIDDSYHRSITSKGTTTPGKARKPEDSVKGSKKRARPGENSRPRPKDRQQFQDRLKELKGIVPNAQKDSIDNLLARTIKHMRFLQSVTKYADQLKQADQPTISGQGNGNGGATWALEVGEETVVCPVMVKDLVPPGLMLIEILCKDQGYFLEIAGAVRGLGLNVLKGVMKAQDDKVWARFVVEASSSMTRTDVLWSLVPLLPQAAANSGVDQNLSSNVHHVSRNYQQPGPACHIGLAEATQ